MEELDLFDYRNIFPLSRTASFVLTLMYLCPFPFSRTSLFLLLKPLCSDKEAAAMLNQLVNMDYLHEDNGFYALASKSIICLDIYKENAPHRSRAISIESLFVYELKSFIVADRLVNAVIPFVQDKGHWPINESDRSTIIRCMIKQIQDKTIPFVKGYNKNIYTEHKNELKYLQEYELNSVYLSKLHAQLNASAIKAKTNIKEADNYNRIHKELTRVEKAIKKIIPICQMLTYENDLKILTLATLEQNGMFVEEMTDTSIKIGLINCAASGIKNYVLRRKLDYAYTFATTFGLQLSVVIYAAERNRDIAEKRLTKLKTPFPLPDIKSIYIPEKLPTRTDYLKELIHIF